MAVFDITGTELTPGNPQQCKGNGEHTDETGKLIECCCDECDYLQVCFQQEKKGTDANEKGSV